MTQLSQILGHDVNYDVNYDVATRFRCFISRVCEFILHCSHIKTPLLKNGQLDRRGGGEADRAVEAA